MFCCPSLYLFHCSNHKPFVQLVAYSVCWSLAVLQELRQLSVAFISAARFLLPLDLIIVPSMAVGPTCLILQSLSWVSCLPGKLPTLSTWPSFLSPFIPLKILSETNTAHFANSQINLNTHFTLPPIHLYLSSFISLSLLHFKCKTSDQLTKN